MRRLKFRLKNWLKKRTKYSLDFFLLLSYKHQTCYLFGGFPHQNQCQINNFNAKEIQVDFVLYCTSPIFCNVIKGKYNTTDLSTNFVNCLSIFGESVSRTLLQLFLDWLSPCISKRMVFQFDFLMMTCPTRFSYYTHASLYQRHTRRGLFQLKCLSEINKRGSGFKWVGIRFSPPFLRMRRTNEKKLGEREDLDRASWN